MGVRRGGQEGALAPLGRPKLVCFYAFFMKICFCPTLEKNLRTPMGTGGGSREGSPQQWHLQYKGWV